MKKIELRNPYSLLALAKDNGWYIVRSHDDLELLAFAFVRDSVVLKASAYVSMEDVKRFVIAKLFKQENKNHWPIKEKLL